MSLQAKVEGWCKRVFKMALDEVRGFYLVNPSNGYQFNPYVYFQKAVDSMSFPDYYTIITNPVDLYLMQKRINGYFAVNSHIEGAFQRFLSDIDLMRDNAHTYNVGDANIEVRICADAVRDYLRYLIRAPLKVAQKLGDPAFVSALFSSPFMSEFVGEAEDERVLHFLLISDVNFVSFLEKANLFKDIGIKSLSPDVRTRLHQITVQSLIQGRVPPKLPSAASAGTSAKKGAKVAKAAPVAVAAPTPSRATSGSRGQTSTSSTATKATPFDVEDDPWASDNDLALPVSSSGKGQASKKRARPSEASVSAAEVQQFHLDPDAEEDPFASIPIKRPAKKMRGVSATLAPEPVQVVLSADPQPMVRESPPWTDSAAQVYKLITKHPYVDIYSKNVIVNFFSPVVEQLPQVAEAYLAKIAQPMDFSIIHDELFVSQSIADAREFADMVVLVFQNCVDFNSTSGVEEHEFTRDLVEKSKFLARLAIWACLEYLPVADDTDMDEESAEERFGFLRKSQQLLARKEREGLLQPSSIEEISMTNANPYTECKKLLKDLERTRTNEEKQQLFNFQVPIDTEGIVDYAMYIRQPMDLSTLKYKLDGTEPVDSGIRKLVNTLAPRYATYGEFLADLRRIFSNAQTYNKRHIEKDVTGVSKRVYDAAVVFAEKLEGLIPRFTLTLVDKIVCARMNYGKYQREHMEMLKRRQEEEEQKLAIRTKMIEDMKRTDPKFALDTDLELKRRQLEKEQQQRSVLSEREILERNLLQQQQSQQAGGSGGALLGVELSPATDMSPSVHSVDGDDLLSPSHASNDPVVSREGVSADRASTAVTGPTQSSQRTSAVGASLGQNQTAVPAVSIAVKPEDVVWYLAGCGVGGLVSRTFFQQDAPRKALSRIRAWQLFGDEFAVDVTKPAVVPSQPQPSSSLPAKGMMITSSSSSGSGNNTNSVVVQRSPSTSEAMNPPLSPRNRLPDVPILTNATISIPVAPVSPITRADVDPVLGVSQTVPVLPSVAVVDSVTMAVNNSDLTVVGSNAVPTPSDLPSVAMEVDEPALTA